MGGIDTAYIAADIAKAGTLCGFMLLVIAGLCWFVLYLMRELKDTRKESTTTINRFIEVVSEQKEIIRAALHQKN